VGLIQTPATAHRASAHLDGGRLKLTKKDPAAHGEHHYIDLGLIASVGDKVTLNVSAAEAQKKAATA
jgi:hypothetical protein